MGYTNVVGYARTWTACDKRLRTAIISLLDVHCASFEAEYARIFSIEPCHVVWKRWNDGS